MEKAGGSRRTRQSRSALLWGLLLFLITQASFSLALDKWQPNLYDPDYSSHLTSLKSRIAEVPDRPLLLMIGSSRTALSFRPECLPPLPTAGAENGRALVYNFSHFGAGPLMNLMALRRLLADGVHPTWLVVEVMPAYFAHDGQQFLLLHAALRDVPLLGRYLPAWRLWARYLTRHSVLSPKYPAELLRRYAPKWAPSASPTDSGAIGPLGGYLLLEENVDEATRSRRTAIVHDLMAPYLRSFEVTPTAERATRELLELCRRERIAVLLLVTPEGPTYRSWYPPEAYPKLERFLHGLASEHHVQVVDARQWLTDAAFYDSHHVIQSGANTFTLKLGQEVLTSFVSSRWASN